MVKRRSYLDPVVLNKYDLVAIETIHNIFKHEVPTARYVYKKRANYTYNPNDYIKISKEEIERQHNENMKSMDDKWHNNNVKANQIP